jgi:hypothetical protein
MLGTHSQQAAEPASARREMAWHVAREPPERDRVPAAQGGVVTHESGGIVARVGVAAHLLRTGPAHLTAGGS